MDAWNDFIHSKIHIQAILHIWRTVSFIVCDRATTKALEVTRNGICKITIHYSKYNSLERNNSISKPILFFDFSIIKSIEDREYIGFNGPLLHADATRLACDIKSSKTTILRRFY